jgi:predicted enzyme related to lactoylglutathione lyase
MRVRSVYACLALLGAVGGAPSARAAGAALPPIVEPGSEHHVGKIIFVELVTPDLAASKSFYAGLFGWSFEEVQTGGTVYAQARLAGRPVAGLVYRKAEQGRQLRSAWLTFMAVRDVDAATAVAVQHGGKLLLAPASVPDRGRQAVLADPQGAVFAMLASSSGDPPDELVAPGGWIWSALLTRDADADAAFYQNVFDYEVFDLGEAEGAQHLLLSSDEYARATANSLVKDQAGAHPHWLNFVRVDDAPASVAKAVAMGARVVVEPRLDRHGGRVAVLTDPQGAPFGVMEWSNDESRQVTP